MVGQENGLFSPQVSLNHLLLCKTQQAEQMRDRHTITSSSPTITAPYQGCRDSDFVFLHISSVQTYVTQVSGALQSFLHLLSNPQFLHLFTFTFPPSVWTEWPPGNFSEPLLNRKGGKQGAAGTLERKMKSLKMAWGWVLWVLDRLHMAIWICNRVAYSWNISSSPGWLLSCAISSAGVLLSCQMAIKGPLLTLF